MIEFKEESNNYNYITRNDIVYLFYRKLDIFGFLSAYVFNKWFEKHNMLTSLVLVPLDKEGIKKEYLKNIESDYEKSIAIFVDVDLTCNDLLKYAKVAKRIEVIDNKDSTIVAIQQYFGLTTNSESNKKKLRLMNKLDSSVLYVVYNSLTTDKYPDEFIDLEDFSYEHLSTDINDYYLKLPQLYGSNFESVDTVIKEKQFAIYRGLKDSRSAVSFVTTQAIDVCYNSSYICKYKDKVLNVANYPPTYSLVILNILNSKPEIDIALVYEEVAGEYYYKALTRKQNIDLLKVFSDYDVFGYKNRIWFKTQDDILTNIELFSWENKRENYIRNTITISNSLKKWKKISLRTF